MRKKLLPVIAWLFFSFTSCFALQNQNVGQRTLMFNDVNRNRPLKTEIWYPTSTPLSHSDSLYESVYLREPTVRDGNLINGKLPLLLLSHGTGGGRLTLEWLAFGFAKAGYIVAAVDHWGNTYDNKIPDAFVKVWDRPQDLSFVLSGLLTTPAFSSRINTDKIYACGFSAGGYTVLALIGGEIDFVQLNSYFSSKRGRKEARIRELPNLGTLLNNEEIKKSFDQVPELLDNRIKGAIALAPALGQGFQTNAQFQNIKVPVMIVGIENDKVAPVKTNALHYHRLIRSSEYRLLSGKAGHYIMLNEATDQLKQEVPFIYNDPSSVSRKDIHDEVIKLAMDFFEKEKRTD